MAGDGRCCFSWQWGFQPGNALLPWRWPWGIPMCSSVCLQQAGPRSWAALPTLLQLAGIRPEVGCSGAAASGGQQSAEEALWHVLLFTVFVKCVSELKLPSFSTTIQAGWQQALRRQNQAAGRAGAHRCPRQRVGKEFCRDVSCSCPSELNSCSIIFKFLLQHACSSQSSLSLPNGLISSSGGSAYFQCSECSPSAHHHPGHPRIVGVLFQGSASQQLMNEPCSPADKFTVFSCL